MDKKYDVILADPPWDYKVKNRDGCANLHYPQMPTDVICNLPIPDLAMKNSILILWCTWPKLPEGLQVMQAWGFDYVTGFPWIKITTIGNNFWGEVEFKTQMGVGFWARGVSEIVMIGRKGKFSPPQTDFIGLLSPNMRHSRKPKDIYHYAEGLPGKKVELFARKKHPGWDVWGNEVPSDLEMEREYG